MKRLSTQHLFEGCSRFAAAAYRSFFSSLFFIFLFFMTLPCTAQIRINEISSANDSVVADEDGDHADWFELYNSGTAPVNLYKHKIVCTETNVSQWFFPNVSIPAKTPLMVYASGKGRKTFVDHWETPIHPGTIWRYLGGNTAPAVNWKDIAFNDAAWTQGTGAIGYGDGDDSTTVASTTTLYMRRKFNLADTSIVARASLVMDYDDGFVAYLNGVEIARGNIGIEGVAPTYTTYALQEHEAQLHLGKKAEWFPIDPTLFRSLIKNGTNAFCIEVHNANSQVDDLSCHAWLAFGIKDTSNKWPLYPILSNGLHTDFSFSSTGQQLALYDSLGVLADQMTVGAMQKDHSRCRIPDGAATWCLSDKPTPAKTNTTSVCYTAYAAAPVLSLNAGFYTGTQSLGMTAAGAVIRYTKNGSVPTAASPVYSAPLVIDSSQVIRARSFVSGMLPSALVTNTYLINQNYSLPVISITTDPPNLWDTNNGIYVMGPNAQTNVPHFGANFWMDWEKPSHVEYFDKNKVQGFELEAGLQIHGGFSKSFPQRSFRIKANDDYGTKSINYNLFPNRTYTKIKSFNIRNFGIDWNTTCMRDGLVNKMMTPTGMETMDQQPCIIYLNGQYWGMYEIREREDEDYLEQLFGVDPDSVDILKNDGMVQEGDNKAFLSMLNFIATANMSVQANYDSVKQMLDVENACDYFFTETYVVNTDWPHNNIRYWRPTAPGGKWRYMLWDVDFSFGLLTNLYKNYCTHDALKVFLHPTTPNPHSSMVSSLLNNTEFKNYFINRSADLINTVFYPTNAKKAVAVLKAEMLPDMPKHFTRWGNSWPNPYGAASSFDVPSWNSAVDTILYHMDNRPFHARNYIQAEFALPKQVDVTLDASPAGSGKIKISTIIPDSLPWDGVYFDGVPVMLSAIPNPGFKFKHWQSNVLIPAPNTNDSVTLTISSNDVFTAYFEVDPASSADIDAEDFKLAVYPNPVSDQGSIVYYLPKATAASLKIYSVIGQEIKDLAPNTNIRGVGEHRLQFDGSDLTSGIYLLELKTKEVSKTVKIIKR